MCSTVWLRRGRRIVELGDVRSFARVVGQVVMYRDRGDKRSRRGIRRFATHCLCPVDVEASARLGGYDLEPTDGWPDYLLVAERVSAWKRRRIERAFADEMSKRYAEALAEKAK